MGGGGGTRLHELGSDKQKGWTFRVLRIVLHNEKNGTDRHSKVLAKSGFILTFTVNHNSQMKNGKGEGETQSKSST